MDGGGQLALSVQIEMTHKSGASNWGPHPFGGLMYLDDINIS